MKKMLISLYGVASYLIGFAGLTAFMLYFGSWEFMPKHINSGIALSNSAEAIAINLGIMILFGLHHSIAARSSFKDKLTKVMPAEMERSTYVLVSGLFMFAIFFYWQPLAGMIWETESQAAIWTLRIIQIIGWLVMVGATFEIDHFHLMGLKQALAKKASNDRQLKEGFLYKIVRHPIQTGVLIGIWSTANMSMTQLMLSVCLTLYIVIGLHYEEKSLIAHFGDAYLDYKKRVPGVIPFWPTSK